MAALSEPQPADAPHWQGNGYEFKPLLQIQASATLETDVLDQLKSGAVSPDSITKIPLLLFSELQGVQGALAQYTPEAHENFAQEMLNEWMAEFAKTNTFGEAA